MMDEMGERGRGVAIYFLRAVAALLLGNFAWYMGNIFLFDSEIGIITVTDGLGPESGILTNISGFVEWAWAVFPFALLAGSAIYVIYGALSEEPYRR